MSKYKLLGLICWKKGFSCSLYLWHSPILHIFPLHICFWTLKSRFLRLDLKLQHKLLLTWFIIYKGFVQNSTKLMPKIKQLKPTLPPWQARHLSLTSYINIHTPVPKRALVVLLWNLVCCGLRDEGLQKNFNFLNLLSVLCHIYITFFLHMLSFL